MENLLKFYTNPVDRLGLSNEENEKKLPTLPSVQCNLDEYIISLPGGTKTKKGCFSKEQGNNHGNIQSWHLNSMPQYFISIYKQLRCSGNFQQCSQHFTPVALVGWNQMDLAGTGQIQYKCTGYKRESHGLVHISHLDVDEGGCVIHQYNVICMNTSYHLLVGQKTKKGCYSKEQGNNCGNIQSWCLNSVVQYFISIYKQL